MFQKNKGDDDPPKSYHLSKEMWKAKDKSYLQKKFW